jgi:hypothetical protein
MRSLLVATVFSLSASLAAAQTSAPIIAYPPQNDMVSLALTQEDWVQTQTARTELAVDASLPGADAGKVRGDILAAIKSLAQGAEWRFTSFNHDQDASGLEHWHAVLEARLPEAQLGGLSDRAKQASKPGTQINVQTIDFTPTLAEIESAKAKLRGDLYKKINEAMVQLNQAESDRKFRIMNIRFENLNSNFAQIAVTAQKRAMGAQFANPPPVGSEDGVELSSKIKMTADVTFSSFAPKE